MPVAKFITSAPNASKIPKHSLPEVAFAGRSNTGKSTLLGCVLGQEKLVRTSRTPGRTQLLNVFSYEDRLMIVDLPGYGYAKLSKKKRAELEKMIVGYFENSAQLSGVVLVVDARRDPPSEYDRNTVEWLLGREIPVLVALTKMDLVPKNKRLGQVRKIEKALGVPNGAALACAGKTGLGRDELRRRLWEWVA